MLKFESLLVLSVLILLQHTSSTSNVIESESDTLPENYYVMNSIPKVSTKDCKIHFECKRKLVQAEVPKPCVKFCVKYIECENGTKTRGQPQQCLELNEQLVMQEYNDCKKDNNYVTIGPVAMIDFPCQPGYLPDSRGRCREIW